jgi:hypothetical protein
VLRARLAFLLSEKVLANRWNKKRISSEARMGRWLGSMGKLE